MELGHNTKFITHLRYFQLKHEALAGELSMRTWLKRYSLMKHDIKHLTLSPSFSSSYSLTFSHFSRY